MIAAEIQSHSMSNARAGFDYVALQPWADAFGSVGIGFEYRGALEGAVLQAAPLETVDPIDPQEEDSLCHHVEQKKNPIIFVGGNNRGLSLRLRFSVWFTF